MIAVMEQGFNSDRYPSAPPARPSVTTGTPPSQATERARPQVITVSYWLWLTACLAGVVTAAVTLSYFDQLHTAMLSIVDQQFPDKVPAKRDEVATAALGIVVGAGVLVILLQVAFAVAMHSGRGWTRFPLVLLTLVLVPYNIVVVGIVPTITKAGLPATTALMLFAVVLMFLPGTQAWFAQEQLARSDGLDSSG